MSSIYGFGAPVASTAVLAGHDVRDLDAGPVDDDEGVIQPGMVGVVFWADDPHVIEGTPEAVRATLVYALAALDALTLAPLEAEFDAALAALRDTKPEAPNREAAEARYRAASDAINHAHREREFLPGLDRAGKDLAAATDPAARIVDTR